MRKKTKNSWKLTVVFLFGTIFPQFVMAKSACYEIFDSKVHLRVTDELNLGAQYLIDILATSSLQNQRRQSQITPLYEKGSDDLLVSKVFKEVAEGQRSLLTWGSLVSLPSQIAIMFNLKATRDKQITSVVRVVSKNKTSEDPQDDYTNAKNQAPSLFKNTIEEVLNEKDGNGNKLRFDEIHLLSYQHEVEANVRILETLIRDHLKEGGTLRILFFDRQLWFEIKNTVQSLLSEGVIIEHTPVTEAEGVPVLFEIQKAGDRH